MRRGRRRLAAVAGAGVICLVLGAAALVLFVESPHPGEKHYQAYCSECHDQNGVFAIIEQRADEAERLFDSAHIDEHAADPGERAQLIAYLKSEMRG